MYLSWRSVSRGLQLSTAREVVVATQSSQGAKREESEVKKIDAVLALIRDAQASRLSASSYRRVVRSCDSLGLSEADTDNVLSLLEYHSSPGIPSRWLTKISTPPPQAPRPDPTP